MSSSRAGLKKKPSTRSGSREVAFSVENPYKPGFIDPSSLESFRMGVDAELSAVSNAFYQQAEVTSNIDFSEDVDGIYEDMEVLAQEIIRVEAETEAGFAAIQGELTIMGGTDEMLAQAILDLEVQVDGNTAAISNESTVRASEDAALAQSITELSASTDAGDAAIREEMSVISSEVDGLQAKWSITADVNGKISGIELTNDGVYSEFSVLADKFSVTDGTTTSEPFSVSGGITRMEVAHVNHIQSNNWDGSNGWMIDQSGTANFQNVVIRGDVTADTFTGVGASGKYFSLGGISEPAPGSSVELARFPINNTTGKTMYLVATLPNIHANGNFYAHLNFEVVSGSGTGVTYHTGTGQFIVPDDVTLYAFGFETSQTLVASATVSVGWSGELRLVYTNSKNPNTDGNSVMGDYMLVNLMVAG